jgi:hypothetical protein
MILHQRTYLTRPRHRRHERTHFPLFASARTAQVVLFLLHYAVTLTAQDIVRIDGSSRYLKIRFKQIFTELV